MAPFLHLMLTSGSTTLADNPSDSALVDSSGVSAVVALYMALVLLGRRFGYFLIGDGLCRLAACLEESLFGRLLCRCLVERLERWLSLPTDRVADRNGGLRCVPIC